MTFHFSTLHEAPDPPFLKGRGWAGHGVMVLVVWLITFVTFHGVLDNDFISFWDDDIYIAENELIKDLSASGLYRIFSTPDNNHYTPLTTLSRAVDYRLFGLEAGGYHGTSLLIHLLNAALVYILILFIGRHYLVAGITALVFAIHPMQVETVAWVTGRGQLLGALFLLGALIAYIRYRKGRRLDYWIALLLFILAILSSPLAVVLVPFMLLMDYRFERKHDAMLWVDKLPFLAIAIGSGIFALSNVQSLQTDQPAISFTNGIFYASYGLMQYILKMWAPYGLSSYYPFPAGGDLPVIYYASLAVDIVVVGGALYVWRANRVLIWGLLFFGAGIFLFLKFSFLNPYGDYVMADRYVYLPFIGLGLITAVYFTKVWLPAENSKPVWRIPAAVVLVIWLVFLMVTAYQRTGIWRNSGTLWEDVVTKYPTAAKANYNLGVWYYERGVLDKAMYYYDQTINYHREHYKALNNRAIIHLSREDFSSALADCNRAISLNTAYADAYYNKGSALLRMGGDPAEAMENMDQAIKLDPGKGLYRYGRSFVFYQLGEPEKARADVRKAVELGYTDLNPEYLKAIQY